MDVERKDLEEGLTDHPVVAHGIYALAYEVFEVEERAPSISPPSVEEITYTSGRDVPGGLRRLEGYVYGR